MAYGRDNPTGFRPVAASVGDVAGQNSMRTARIPSGYDQNLMLGDPVTLTVQGFLQKADVPTNNPVNTPPIIGYFGGCIFRDALGNLNQAKSWWPANTALYNGTYAQAFYYANPYMQVEVQFGSGAAAAAFTSNMIGDACNFAYSANAALLQNSLATGQSVAYIDTATVTNPNANGSNYLPFIIQGVSTNAQNPGPIGGVYPAQAYPQFINVIVTANSAYLKGPAITA